MATNGFVVFKWTSKLVNTELNISSKLVKHVILMSSRHLFPDEYSPQREKCRACSDFKNWTKHQGHSQTEKPKSIPLSEQNIPEKKECPLDREELGRASWGLLHTMAAYFPKKPSMPEQNKMKQFLNLFSDFYPCKECADDFKIEISKSPPAVSSREELSQWMCNMHNIVNIKLGKPIFDCKNVDERWRTGWKDGSCD